MNLHILTHKSASPQDANLNTSLQFVSFRKRYSMEGEIAGAQLTAFTETFKELIQ